MGAFNNFAVKKQFESGEENKTSPVLSTCLNLSAVSAASLTYDDELRAEEVCVSAKASMIPSHDKPPEQKQHDRGTVKRTSSSDLTV